MKYRNRIVNSNASDYVGGSKVFNILKEYESASSSSCRPLLSAPLHGTTNQTPIITSHSINMPSRRRNFHQFQLTSQSSITFQGAKKRVRHYTNSQRDENWKTTRPLMVQQMIRDQSYKSSLCCICNNNPASWRCVECQSSFLCEGCNENHHSCAGILHQRIKLSPYPHVQHD